MKKLWHFVEKLLGIYRWHPTIALRYLPIISELKKNGFPEVNILEVGSGSLGIVPYLRRKVVGIDIAFSEPIHKNLIPVIGDAKNIPFSDSSFDIVVSTDMLEHILPDHRSKVIEEMIRVGKKFVAIGIPCGLLAEEQDKKLAILYQKVHDKEFNFFTEHRIMGLPDAGDINAEIEKAAFTLGKKITIVKKGTLNLKLREILMRGWISDNIFMNILFRKILLLALPVLNCINFEPTYRQIFFIKIST